MISYKNEWNLELFFWKNKSDLTNKAINFQYDEEIKSVFFYSTTSKTITTVPDLDERIYSRL